MTLWPRDPEPRTGCEDRRIVTRWRVVGQHHPRDLHCTIVNDKGKVPHCDEVAEVWRSFGDAFAGQYSEAAWCAVELEKASGTQADAEAAALLETASQRRAALTQVGSRARHET